MKKINKKSVLPLFLALVLCTFASYAAEAKFETIHEWIEEIENNLQKQSPKFWALYQKLPLEEKLVILQDKLRTDEEIQNTFSEIDVIQALFPEI